MPVAFTSGCMLLSRLFLLARTLFGFIAALGLLLGLNLSKLPSLNKGTLNAEIAPSDPLQPQMVKIEQIDKTSLISVK